VTSDLLMLAEALARLDRTRPKQVNLRRAASTCYYAMFHALAQVTAGCLVGEGRDPASRSAYTRVYRALSHSQSKKVLARQETRRFGPNLSRFADAFITLQEAREQCDYDPLPLLLSRQTVLSYVDLARAAVSHLQELPPESRLDLATSLLFLTRR
jgi:uncharacterized protein (UPF0332 family)